MRQNQILTVRWLLLLTISSSSYSFTIPTAPQHNHITSQSSQSLEPKTPSSILSTLCSAPFTKRNRCTAFRMAEGDDDDSISFDDATQAIRDEEDNERMGERNEMADEERRDFNAKSSTYDDMRAKIRARTADLDIEKSVTTAEAIKAATDRALSGEAAAASSPFTPDLSKITDGASGFSKNADGELDPDEILTDEQKAEIDEIGQMNYWEQAVAEFGYTKFPSFIEISKQAGLMVVIFAVTATVILNVDEALRTQYTDWGLIPRMGETLDYSDLTLPEGFTDQMTEDDLANL